MINTEEEKIEKLGMNYVNKERRKNELYLAWRELESNKSVETLTKKAYVSRGTFFNYFKDFAFFKTYCMNKWVLDRIIDNEFLTQEDIAEIIKDCSDLEILTSLAHCMEKNREFVCLTKEEIDCYLNLMGRKNDSVALLKKLQDILNKDLLLKLILKY